MTFSLDGFKRALVHVLDSRGQVCGGGLLVSSRYVLTCARVAAHALGGGAAVAARAGEVGIELPLVGPESHSARVASATGELGGELALLELRAPLAVEGHSLFSTASSLANTRFVAWVAHGGRDLGQLPLSGTLGGEIVNGLHAVEVHSGAIGPGCAGVPAVDPATGQVLGLIVPAAPEAAGAAVLLIPARQILELLRSSGLLSPEPPLVALAAWARARYSLRWPLRAEVLKFIRSYQDGPGGPRPFAGREDLMGQLDQWLRQGNDRLRLLCGPAGRGKSALLLNWLGRLIQGGSTVTLLYVPVSIRFNTAGETAGIQLLFSALCDVFPGLRQQLPQQPEIQDYLQGCAAAWQEMAQRSGEEFLLAVDGLDEAINDWFVKRRILPSELPANLHVLIAARHKPGDADGLAWLDGLRVQGVSAAQVLEIHKLDSEALAETVIQLGLPLDRLAGREAFGAQLYRLTGDGDPLLLTLWLAQIWRHRDALPDPAELARLRPGFAELYTLWMQEQQPLWAANGLTVDAHDFGQVMHVLAAAQGRMRPADLAAVLGCLGNARSWQPEELRAVLETAQRLVTGDANGYVLVHPRLAQHFQEELDANPQQGRALQAAFRRWGAGTVRRLNSGELSASECPPYLLTHYVSVHLGADEEGDARSFPEHCLPLLRRGWAEAWHAREGAWEGYRNDLRQLARCLQDYNQRCASAGRHSHVNLAAELRCALLAASIRSRMGNIPAPLLLALALNGIWSIARAARVARQYEPSTQIYCLSELAGLAAQTGAADEAEALLLEARQAAAAIQHAAQRAEALSTVAAQSQQADARRQVRRQALDAAAASAMESGHASSLVQLAYHLQGDAALLQEALAVAAAIAPADARASALSALAAWLPDEERHTVLYQALHAAASIADERQRAGYLRILVGGLQGEVHRRAMREAAEQLPDGWVCEDSAFSRRDAQAEAALLQEALGLALTIKDASPRAMVLVQIAVNLHGPAQGTALQHTWEAIAAIEPAQQRVQPLCSLADGLDENLRDNARDRTLQQALAAATQIEREGDRAEAVRAVAQRLAADSPLLQQLRGSVAAMEDEEAGEVEDVRCVMLPEEAGENALRESLAMLRDPASRARALNELAEHLEGEARSQVLEEALQEAAAVSDEEGRCSVLLDLVQNKHGEIAFLKRALTVASGLQSVQIRGRFLYMTAGILPPEVLPQALAITAAIQDRSECAGALRAVAAELQGGRRIKWLQQALQVIGTIHDPERHASALDSIIPELQAEPALLQHALEVAAAIRHNRLRAYVLGAASQQLQGPARRHVLQQAVAAVAAIEDEHARSIALQALVVRLQDEPDLLQQVLEMGAATKGAYPRASAMTAVARQLHGAARSDVLQQALQAAMLIEEEHQEHQRAYILSNVAFLLQGHPGSTTVRLILDEAAKIQSERGRAVIAGELAPHVHGDSAVLQHMLGMAALMEESPRAQLLRAVAGVLQEGSALLPQVLQAAREIRDGYWRATILAAAAARQQGETQRTLREEALQAAMATTDRMDRVLALGTLAPQLEERARNAVLQQALQTAVTALKEGEARTTPLRRLLDLLEDGEAAATILQAAVSIEHEWRRHAALAMVSEWLAPYPRLQATCLRAALALPETIQVRMETVLTLVHQNPSLLTYDVWCEFLKERLPRENLLNMLAGLTKGIVKLTGSTEALEEIAEAIQEVCEWFP